MKKTTLLLQFLLALGLSACNLPADSTSDTLPLEAQAGTLAAQTVSASLTSRPKQTPAPANTPTKTRPTFTPAPIGTPSPTGSPTPTKDTNPPAAPSLKKYNFICTWNGSGTQMEMTIRWTDKSDNELGFLVYRNGAEIARLTPNTLSYTDITPVSSGQPVNYAVSAYNNSGTSGKITFSAKCE